MHTEAEIILSGSQELFHSIITKSLKITWLLADRNARVEQGCLIQEPKLLSTTL